MNSILSSFLLIEGLSPLVPEDAELFRTRFKQAPSCYANSWLYILRSSRNEQGYFGFKYQDENSLFSIGFRDNVVYIVNPDGNEVANKVLKLCNAFTEADSQNREIVIKKTSEQVAKALIETNLFAIAAENFSKLLEDELFPEHVLELEFTFPFGCRINSKAQNLRRKYESFERTGVKLCKHDDLSVFGNNALYEGLQTLSRTNHNKWLAYKSIIDEVCMNPSFYKASVFTYNEKIHGIYISDVFRKDMAGLYCALTSREYQGMTEWMDVVFFQNLLKAGIKKLYLGGSESEGVHVYVKKLLPQPVKYKMTPLIYLKRNL